MDFSRVGKAKANSNVMVESCISFPNGEPSTVANGSTCAFVCNSLEQVREFHDVALANGGRVWKVLLVRTKAHLACFTSGTFGIWTVTRYVVCTSQAEPGQQLRNRLNTVSPLVEIWSARKLDCLYNLWHEQRQHQTIAAQEQGSG